ncbi:MAG: hypothetical protein ACYSYU_07910 [Planctomycetota bacterium]
MWDRLKAWWRGERRLAVPRRARGRIYKRKESGPPGIAKAKTRLIATVKARVYRAAEDRWEDV